MRFEVIHALFDYPKQVRCVGQIAALQLDVWEVAFIAGVLKATRINDLSELAMAEHLGHAFKCFPVIEEVHCSLLVDGHDGVGNKRRHRAVPGPPVRR